MTVKEDFLYHVWKFSKLQLKQLQTANGEVIRIINLGTHNLHAGPDFFNARIKIGNQLWAGNVEMHVNASDWLCSPFGSVSKKERLLSFGATL